jgi:hypothetical protein
MEHRRFRSVPGTSLVLLVWAVVGLAFSGCGSEEIEGGLVPVTGRVTLDGGAWPSPGYITFSPRAQDVNYQAASVEFDKDGNFTVIGGYGGAEGMHPGEYWVSVDCPEDPGAMPVPGKEQEPPKNFAPAKYQRPETSGFSLDVPKDGNAVEAKFDVKTNG